MFPYVNSRLGLLTLLDFSGDNSDGGGGSGHGDGVVDYIWGLYETHSLNLCALESYSLL